MKSLFLTKIKASTIHLVISVAVISLFLILLKMLWYPGPLFRLENVWAGLQILIPVDAVLGPILTFIIFKPGKKHLNIDLSVIAGLQVAALIYGGLLIYQQRPVVLTFVVDRFETILASENIKEKIEEIRPINNDDHPLPLTYALPAQSVKESNYFILNGIQFHKIPERNYPLSDYMDIIIAKSLDPNKFNDTEENKKILNNFKQEFNQSNSLLLPLQGTLGDTAIIVIDKNTGKISGYLNINPWEEYNSK